MRVWRGETENAAEEKKMMYTTLIKRCLAVAKRPCDCCVHGSGFAKYNWKTIRCGHYGAIINKCD